VTLTEGLPQAEGEQTVSREHGRVKRAALLSAIVLAAVAPAAATSAPTAKPCANGVVQEWLRVGHVADDHPVACYREALERVDDYTDLAVYSDLSDSIDAALAAAVAKRAGKPVPERYREQLRRPRPAAAAATPVASTERSSVPAPLLVLAAVAVGLTALGAGGAALRRRRAT